MAKKTGLDLLKEIKKTVTITSEQIDKIDVDVVSLCKEFLKVLQDMVKTTEEDRTRITAINAFFDNSAKLHTITTQIAMRTAEKLKNLQIIKNLESPVQEVIEFTDSPIVVDESKIRIVSYNQELEYILDYLIPSIEVYQKQELKKYSKFKNKTSESVLRITVEGIMKILEELRELKHRDEKDKR